MNCNPIPEREDWFITDMKPTICAHCGAKEVRKAVLAFSLFFRKYAYIGFHIGVDDYASSRWNVERN